ncbi:MAG: DUF4124 domain-containing protein [Pseudomonadota bacterium]
MKSLILALFLLLLPTLAIAQPIYKVVDEDGNVTYTDQRPSEDAEPMVLPELNVLDSRSSAPPVTPGQTSDPDVEPLQLTIVTPQNEENIRGTGNTLTVALESSIELPASALIVFYLNGEAQEPIRTLNHTFDFIPRGEHSLRAELQTGSGRVLAQTESVTFYMRQASQLTAPPS